MFEKRAKFEVILDEYLCTIYRTTLNGKNFRYVECFIDIKAMSINQLIKKFGSDEGSEEKYAGSNIIKHISDITMVHTQKKNGFAVIDRLFQCNGEG